MYFIVHKTPVPAKKKRVENMATKISIKSLKQNWNVYEADVLQNFINYQYFFTLSNYNHLQSIRQNGGGSFYSEGTVYTVGVAQVQTHLWHHHSPGSRSKVESHALCVLDGCWPFKRVHEVFDIFHHSYRRLAIILIK